MPTFIFVRNPDNGELTLVEIPAGAGTIAPQPGIPGPDPTTEGCSDNPINTICGFGSGLNITTATNTSIFGVASGQNLATGGNNSFFGNNAGRIVAGGVGNTLLGSGTATALITGSQNVVVGNGSALNFNGVESQNLILYSPAQANDSKTIRIGEEGVHEAKTFIKGIHDTLQTGGNILNVTVDVNGHMGTDGGGGIALIGLTDTEQTLLGMGAMENNISGDSNVVMGFNALNFATTAGESVILGAHACENALNQGRGIFIGANSGLNADMTSGTVAVGFNSLQNLSGSSGNTCAYGFESLQACTSGGGNSAYGALSLKNLTTSVLNTAVGRFTMNNIKDGCDSNVGCGAGALSSIGLGVLGTGVGSSNTGCGTNSLGLLGGQVAGDDFNSALGRSAGGSTLFGSSNLYLGHLSGSNHGDTTPGENNNILLMSPGVLAEQNSIHLGNFSTHTSCFVAGINGTPSGTPVACIQDPLTGEMGAGQVQMNGSGDMSNINSMDINGSGQILLQTSQIAGDAIKLNATGGGIDLDSVSFIDINTSLANTQALKLTTSDPASGMIFTTGLGGFEMTSTGAYDWHTSIDQAGQGIKFRASGTQGEIQLDAGTGGVRIMDATGLFINDPSSAFQQQLIVPTIASDIQWTFPTAQGGISTVLENDGAGVLSWVSGGGSGTSPDSTGVLNGGLLTVNGGDTTKFDIEDGDGLIYNPSTQVKTTVSWSGLTAQDNGGWTGILTYVSINSVGAIIYDNTKVTNTQTRSQIFLGVLVHVDGVNIDVTNDEQVVLVNYVNSIRDLSEALGFVNISGNTMSAVGANLKIQKSSGTMFKFGANWGGDESNPHVVSLASIDTSGAGIFQYRMQDGTSSSLSLTDVIPNIQDDNTAYPGTTYANNRYGVSRVFCFTSNNLKIQPPQFDYANLDDALAGISSENFVVEPSILENGMLIGFFITRGNTTAMNDLSDVLFISAGKLGSVSSTGGSGGDASTDISSSTLNRACVFAGTTGKILTQDSAVVINSGAISGVTDLQATGTIDFNPATSFNLVTATQINIESSQSASDAIHINASNASGGILLQALAGYRFDDADVGGLILDDSTSAFDTTIKCSALNSENNTITLPPAFATLNGQVLSSTTGGVTSWSTVSSGLPTGYLSGFRQVNTSTTVLTFGTTGEPSKCRDIDDSFDLQWASATETITTSVTGVGGITDTQNPVVANQGYEVYIVGDTTLSNATDILAVEVSTDITTVLEFTSSDFDVYRRIGWFVTQDGTTAIIPHTVGGKARMRSFHYTGGRTSQTILFGGSSTSFVDMVSSGDGSDQYTAPGAHHMICRIAFGDSASANDEVGFRQNGSTLAITNCEYTFSSGSPLAVGELSDSQILIHLGSDRITEYTVTSASNNAYCYVISFVFGI